MHTNGPEPGAREYVELRRTQPAMKSAKLLEMFSTYCRLHPELRFWQALVSWAGYGYLFLSNDKPAITGLYDTFHWEDNYKEWPR